VALQDWVSGEESYGADYAACAELLSRNVTSLMTMCLPCCYTLDMLKQLPDHKDFLVIPQKCDQARLAVVEDVPLPHNLLP